MEYEIVTLQEQLVAGFTVRTNNHAPDVGRAIDALWRHTFTPLGYLQLGLASLMIGLIYMAMNLVVSFLGNVTVTSVFYMISVLAGMAVYILAVWLDAPVERLLSLNPLLLWGGCLTLTVLIVLVCYGISLKLFERRR